MKIFEGFLPYMGMAAILVMCPRLLTYLMVPHPIDASHKIWLQLVKWFQRRRCLNIMVIYMYIAPGCGSILAPGVHSFQNH